MFFSTVLLLASAAVFAESSDAAEPIVIAEQGSFAVGGKVLTKPASADDPQPAQSGKTLHGDHGYVFFQVPANARKHPLVLLHGYGQSARTWETTPDGREGFQNIFLRRGYPVYLMDQPRRGRAGQSTQPIMIAPEPRDAFWFNIFRIGTWPKYFPGVQFSRDPETLNQYFRQMTPDTGPFDLALVSDAVVALFDKIGPGILVTHSHGGGPGWLAAIRSRKVRAVVSYEPGSNFMFPLEEVPPAMPSAAGPLEAVGVPPAEFQRFTEIPIVIYYGDNIPNEPVANPGQDNWRVRLAMARLWADAVNRRGGNVTVVHLPEIGVFGNTHFPFSDLNNLKIAELLSEFLEKNDLD